MRKTFFISLLALCLTASAWAVNVAKIGTTEYATLAEAISAATAGQTVQLIADINQTNGVLINKDLTLDLNNHTYTCTNGSNVNNRAIKITAGTVAIQNGTIIGEPTANFEGGCYGPFRIDGQTANVTLQNLTLQNGRHYGLGIKLVAGYLYMNNCTVISQNGGGGLEVAGTAEVVDCTFTQTGLDNSHKWISTCLAACDNGVLNVSGGTYTSEHWSLYIYTSGGEMDIEGGNFTGDVITEMDNNSYPSAVGIINITDGTFEGASGNPVNFTATTDNDHITISGGSFDAPVPAAYCAEGFVPVTTPNAQGKYVVELVNVAKIGATLYPTLEAALAHASEGEIILLADVDVTAQVEIAAGVNAVIDLAGHKIEYTGATTLTSGVLLVHNGAILTINDSSDPDAGAIVAGNKAYAAIALTKAGDNAANPAVLTVNGGTLTGYYYAIVGNGSRHNTITTINGGILNATCPGDNLGIYHPQNGTLTINNGAITAYSAAIEMRAGTLVINGGTFTATAPTFTCNANGSGTTTEGAAIAIAQHTTKKDIAVTINGGEFNGVKAINESNPQVNDPAPQVNMTVTDGEFNGAVETVDVNNFVSGGTFNAPVAEAYCAPGFVSVTAPNAQGMYVVEPVDYQREVTNTFGTLCLPKDGVVYGATVFTPSYKTGCMIVFDEVAENRIEGGRAYLFQRNANSGRVSVKYDDANAQDAEIVYGGAMIGSYEPYALNPSYDYCIVWNDKYYHVTSANVYVGANCAYIDLNQIPDSYVAPVPGRRRISFQDAAVNDITGVEEIEAAENAGVQKVMLNGQLYIIRGEQIYNVAGQVVK
jgi:hypothetical protein